MPDLCKIVVLSEKFYENYSEKNYPELLRKKKRPYTCLSLDINGYTVCIPFRTDMKHPNGYYFKKSKRSARHHSGLDYSKSVIVAKEEYIEKKQALVDNDEFRECLEKLPRIEREIRSYIENYQDYENGKLTMHDRKFKRKYQYTTLKYFHEELGIRKDLSLHGKKSNTASLQGDLTDSDKGGSINTH